MPLPKIRKLAVAAIVIGAGYYAYTMFMPQGGGWGAGGPPPVSVAEVVSRKVRQWNEFSGRLVAVNQAEVRPRVSGIIEKVHFEDGAIVNKDDVLFTIDPRPFETVHQSASARAALAESELRRAQRLLAEKAIPQHEYDQRKNDAEVARAELASAKLNLEYASVKAPIAGRVSRAEITAGNLVEVGAQVLTTVVTNTPIYADFEIDEATFLTYAHAGVTGHEDVSRIPVMMTLTGKTESVHNGHIESFDNHMNTTSGTIRVRAVFDNANNVLVPGLFARIRLGGPAENDAALITDRAVGTDQSKKFVYLVGPENKVEYREVKLGALADDGLRIVTSGVKPGDKIVVNGTQRVMMPGQPVTPEMVPMDAKEQPAAAPQTADAKQ